MSKSKPQPAAKKAAPKPKAKKTPKFKPPTAHEQINTLIRELPSGVSPIAADHIATKLREIQNAL